MIGCLRCIVDLLLLTGTNRLTGGKNSFCCVFAALLGGVHGLICMMPGFYFLQHGVWYLICLGVVCMFAFGWRMGAIRQWAIFFLLHLALNGAVIWIGASSIWSVVICVSALVVICLLAMGEGSSQNRLIPLHLSYGAHTIQLTALYDTGNQLRDPVTGQGVVVIGAEAAAALTGLTAEQLKKPVETMASGILPGLRLVPYRSIGQPGGLMLAMRFPNTKLDGKQINALVAFAPAGLEQSGEYQALTGGYCA